MPIKYADITININSEKESLLDYFSRFFGNESINDNDTIIILFDDQTICDVKNEYIDKKFKFEIHKFVNDFLPYYFITNDNNYFYYKIPININNGIRKININNIFKNYPRFSTYKKVESFYTFIYYDITNLNEVFSIIKNGLSNNNNPRYSLAYDDTCFKRDDIIYLVNCVFKNKFKI